MERKNAWLSYTEADEKELEETCAGYREFLDKGKTERECVDEIIRRAEQNGYRNLDEIKKSGETLMPGAKVYAAFMNKTIALYHLGEDDLKDGLSILCAHIDSPRLDIKQNPLYVDTDLAYLDTHYYGGVKKYQWVALPLAVHGVVAKKDGTVLKICIGEDEADPIVYITDLLIHLSGKQLQKTAAEVVEGENLDILVGSRPRVILKDFLHSIEHRSFNDRFMHPLDLDAFIFGNPPVLFYLIADFGLNVLNHGAQIQLTGQNAIDGHDFPLWILTGFESAVIIQSLTPLVFRRRKNSHVVQRFRDSLRVISIQLQSEYHPNYIRRERIDDQVIFVLRVFLVAVGSEASDKLSVPALYVQLAADLHRNIPAV